MHLYFKQYYILLFLREIQNVLHTSSFSSSNILYYIISKVHLSHLNCKSVAETAKTLVHHIEVNTKLTVIQWTTTNVLGICKEEMVIHRNMFPQWMAFFASKLITTLDITCLEKAWDDAQENRTWSIENFGTFTAAFLETMKMRNNLKNIHQ